LTENIGWITISTDTTKTGIEDVANGTADNLTAMPSVASEAVLVKDGKATKVSLYNINGLRIKEAEMNEGQVTLTVNGLPKGVYILRTNTNRVTRFIKK
jgi:hypothetical protein